VRAQAAAEAAGFPAVSIVATGFVAQANAIAGALGVGNLRLVEFPGVPMTDSPQSIREKVASHIVDPLVEQLTSPSRA
jgi:hypothetical protein